MTDSFKSGTRYSGARNEQVALACPMAIDSYRMGHLTGDALMQAIDHAIDDLGYFRTQFFDHNDGIILEAQNNPTELIDTPPIGAIDIVEPNAGFLNRMRETGKCCFEFAGSKSTQLRSFDQTLYLNPYVHDVSPRKSRLVLRR